MAYQYGYAGGYSGVLEQAPTLIVELSQAVPTAADPLWADITADVMSVTTKRGRQRELDRFRAGTFTVTLDNRDADYSPDNLSSPYAGHLKPMRRIRVRATYQGTTYPIIDGYIDAIVQEYEGPNNARAVITATDAFKVLAAAELPVSAYAYEVGLDGPAHWWRLDEGVNASVAYDSIADADAAVQGATVVTGEPSLIARDPGAAMTGAAIGDNIRIPAGAGPTGTGGFTVEFVINTAATPSARGRVLGSVGDDVFEVGIGAYAIGVAPPYMWVGDSTVIGDYSAASNVSNNEFAVTNPGPVHVAAVREAAGTLKLYVDGVNVTGTITGVGPDNIPTTMLDFGTQRLNVEDVITGTFDELAIYDRALTAGEIAVHAAAISTPWDNDTPGERAERVLEAVGWPADRADLDTGSSTFQSADLGSDNLLGYLHKIAESEFGALFVTRDGVVRLVGRESLWNRPESYTFSDAPVDTGHLPYMSLMPEFTDALIRNEVTISRFDGVAQTVRDEDSIAEYLPHSYTLEGLLHDDDQQSRYAAQLIVSEYAEPLRRISRLVVNPREADHISTVFPAVLDLELLDEITVIERPPGSDTITQDSVVEGISHTIRPLNWQTTFQLSPAFTDTFWQIGVPGRSEIGVTTRVGF